MLLTHGVHLVGSGWLGLSLTHPLDCNVYLIVDGSRAALVDSGVGRDPPQILDQIGGAGVTRVDFVALTHKHADHSGGAARLAAELGARVYAPASIIAAPASADEDALDLTAARRAGHYPSDYTMDAHPVRHGMSLAIGDARLEVHATPGHTNDHHAYLLRRGGDRLLSCGDLVFARGRISPPVTPDRSIQDLRHSLEQMSRLASGDAPARPWFAGTHGWQRPRAARLALTRCATPPTGDHVAITHRMRSDVIRTVGVRGFPCLVDR